MNTKDSTMQATMQDVNNGLVCLINLGCKVNKYESDCIATMLHDKGYKTTYDLCKADYYVVNTCAVTNEAEKKSRQHVAKILKVNPEAKIIMCGCACVKNKHKIAEMKGVVAVVGNTGKEHIADIICGSQEDYFNTPQDIVTLKNPHKSQTRGYLKIQDGCNRFCTYCLVPYIRGRSISRPLEDVVLQAQSMAHDFKEIVLTGIDMSDYKIGGEFALAELIRALSHINVRLRISSLEVNVVTKELLEATQQLQNFCPSFHLSLQSGSNEILKKMNRKYTATEYLEKVALIRQYYPKANITTDVIVGFAGETEAEFNETVELCKAVGFGEMHVFPYSKRSGTVSENWKDLDKAIKKTRSKQLIEIGNALRLDYLKSLSGTKEQVLVEQECNGYMVGYSKSYIKCYLPLGCKPDTIIDVVLHEPFFDGVRAEPQFVSQ